METPISESSPGEVQPTIIPLDGIDKWVEDLLSKMTLEEKIGQMTQIEKNSLPPGAVKDYFIGSVLSGGGGHPQENTAENWVEMISAFQKEALETRLAIPILYGVDAVHGHNNLNGAVIFPHNIGLGATRDAGLVYQIGRATAEELAATGVHWNFAPTIAVPQDIRWGRTYEGYGQDNDLVAELGVAYLRGLQGESLSASHSILANPKHYIADGATTFGSSNTVMDLPPEILLPGATTPFKFFLDQGDARIDEATLREIHLKPYVAALEAGARIIMASFSSWNGEKLHAHHYLLTDVLKRELGFKGFVISDYMALHQLSPDYYQAVVMGINAGIDMSMVPMDYAQFISTLKQAVENGDVSQERIDDAVRRILRIKFESGLFEQPFADPQDLSLVGSEEHRRLARQAVAESQVLLKNEGNLLPLSKSMGPILVAGQGADDLGLQCGGWTVEWQGVRGNVVPGTTILKAIQDTVAAGVDVYFDPEGKFEDLMDVGSAPLNAYGIVVIAEEPYAEGFGDREDLSLTSADISLLERVRARVEKLVVILLSGRPLILSDQLPLMEALVAAWLPGTEGQGVADVLFGDVPFTGKLSYAWPRTMEQVPLEALLAAGPQGTLFPYGFGLPLP